MFGKICSWAPVSDVPSRAGNRIFGVGFDPAGLYFIGKMWIWVVEGSVQGPDLADDSLGTALHTPRDAPGKVWTFCLVAREHVYKYFFIHLWGSHSVFKKIHIFSRHQTKSSHFNETCVNSFCEKSH